MRDDREPGHLLRPGPSTRVLTRREIGILHTIFFHRFFPSLAPGSREVLDITLPFVDDAELDTMIEKRAAELARELDAERTHSHSSASHAPLHHHLSQQRGGAAAAVASNGGRGNISVQFFEKKRRKTWYMRAAYGGGDEEVCWECWTVKVTVAEPKTESGEEYIFSAPVFFFRAPLLSISDRGPTKGFYMFARDFKEDNGSITYLR